MLSTDLLKLQDGEQVKNSYYRSPRVSPNIRKEGPDCLVVYTAEDRVEIIQLEEVILYVISEFKFAPYWLVQKWYDDVLNDAKKAFVAISSWLKVGLVWVETTPTGVYLRPTRFLLDIYNEDVEKKNYEPIPFNNLSHNIAEAQLVFDIMYGNPKSELWNIVKDEDLLPKYHPILTDLNTGEVGLKDGTIVIREAIFRKGNMYKSAEQLMEQESLIKDQIRSGARFTEEFSDFSLFPIVTVNQTGAENKGELYTQNPDLLIPIPRKEGIAQSYAIELELTAKTAERYDLIMQSYKNNIKFGKVFYLCASQRIMKMVKDAFNRANGLGTCQLFIVPYTAPSMEIANFTQDSEVEQMELFNVSNSMTT